MSFKRILGATLSALLLTGTITHANEPQQPAQVAAAPQSQVASNTAASASRAAWYSDPIIFGLAVFALFAAIDIAILIAKNGNHDNRQHYVR